MYHYLPTGAHTIFLLVFYHHRLDKKYVLLYRMSCFPFYNREYNYLQVFAHPPLVAYALSDLLRILRGIL